VIVLVRHGDAAAGWGDDLDPGLSALGQQQALTVASVLDDGRARPIYTSPLRRCRETAAPLVARWGVDAVVEPGVGEIEAPDPDLTHRAEWLAGVLPGRWSELAPELRAWRDDVLACLAALDDDCVVFTHFVAINVAIGAATGDDRVVCRRVENCSRTTLSYEDGAFVLHEAPAEATHLEVL
jgi:broad specificity phosphatase PhoE